VPFSWGLVRQRGQALTLVEAVLVVAATSAAVTLVAMLAFLTLRQLSPVVRVLAAQVLAH
jgi:hypothetical protein